MRRSVAERALAGVIILIVSGAGAPVVPATGTPVLPVAGGPFDHVSGIPPAWKVDFDANVKWLRATPQGHLLVATSKGMRGLDPETGRTLWTHRHLVDLPEAGLQTIAETSLVVLTDGKRKGQIAVLDARDGRIVFDSRAARFSGVVAHGLVPKGNGLSIVGLKDGGRTVVMAMIDVPNGRMRWENASALSGGGASLATLGRTATPGRTPPPPAESPVIHGSPIEIDADSFLIHAHTGIVRVASRTGQVLWTNRDFRDLSAVRLFLDPARADRCFVAGEPRARAGGVSNAPGTAAGVPALYAALNLADGRSLWRQPVRVQGRADAVILTDKGLVVSPRGSGEGILNLIDAETGKPHWGPDDRGLDIQGSLIDFRPTTDGWVVTTGREHAADGRPPESSLNILDIGEGRLRFERPIKVRGRLLQAENLGRALLFVTTHEIGLVHPRTGKPLAAPVLSAEDLLTARHEDALYAFAPGTGSLHLVDLKKATISGISDRRIRLADGDTPMALAATGDRVTLLGRTGLAGFDRSGKLRFQADYPAPFDPRIAAPLHRARESAPAPGRDSALFVVETGKDAIGFAKVLLSTGAVEGMVRMRGDLVPVYEVDPAGGRLYHRPASRTIAAYKF
jgi:outer membrane protein assembly factor BamB